MKIDRIYVAGYRHDVQFTHTCVASIRQWYPDISITLIKDRYYGDYSTLEIEKYFHCTVLEAKESRFGWGFGKLEPLFAPERHRFLVLDSDIALVGPVLTRLEKFSEDFVVQWEDPTPEFMLSHYFNVEKLKLLDPAFHFPGYSFNTGQWVGTSGLLSRDDFLPWLKTISPPQLKHPEVFQCGEQGLLNYLLMKHSQAGRFTLVRDGFMEVGNNPAVAGVELGRLTPDSPYNFLIHWCGLRKPDFSKMSRGDILEYFEQLYYARLPLGDFRRNWFYTQRDLSDRLHKLARKLFPRRS